MGRSNFSLFNTFGMNGISVKITSPKTLSFDGTSASFFPNTVVPSGSGLTAWYSADFLTVDASQGITSILDQAPSGGNNDVLSADISFLTRSVPQSTNAMTFISGTPQTSVNVGAPDTFFGHNDTGFHFWTAFQITASVITFNPTLSQNQSIYYDGAHIFIVLLSGSSLTSSNLHVGVVSGNAETPNSLFRNIRNNEKYVLELWRNPSSKTVFSRLINTTGSTTISSSVVTVIEDTQSSDGIYLGENPVIGGMKSFNGYLYDLVLCNVSQSNLVSANMSNYFFNKLGTVKVG